MADKENTVTIKLTRGPMFENIIGEQELEAQREAFEGEGFSNIPIRDKQGNILGFEDEFQQGIELRTPTALSQEQRRAQESEGFQQGLAPQEDETDFGRPDLSKSIQASAELSRQIKESEDTLLRLQRKTVKDFKKTAKSRKTTLGEVLKEVDIDTKRHKDLIKELKDKKSFLEEIVFGKKPTPSEALAEKKFQAAKPGREIVETTPGATGDIEPGGPGQPTRSFTDVPVETGGIRGKELDFRNRSLALKEKKFEAKLLEIEKGKTVDPIKIGEKINKLLEDQGEILDLLESGELNDKQVDRFSILLGKNRKQIKLLQSFEKKAKPDNATRLEELFGKQDANLN